MADLFILSALAPDQRSEGALTPAGHYAGLQALLGWDAGLRAFAAAVAEAGGRAMVTLAPELFFTPASRALLALRNQIPDEELTSAVHVRFGPPRYSRILRGAKNFLAMAEGAAAPPATTGAHILRDHDTAPQGFAAALDLIGAARPLHRPDGSVLPARVAPACLITADVPPPRAPTGPVTAQDFAGIDINALTRFNAGDWSSGTPPGFSDAARRIMLDHNAAEGRGRAVVLLPWNLAHHASLVPDLCAKFAHFGTGEKRAPFLLLLPFNAPHRAALDLWPAIEALRARIARDAPAPDSVAIDEAESRLMVARITSLEALPLLLRLRAVAWIESSDPQAIFTRARLAAAGVGALMLGMEGGEEGLDVLTQTGTIEVNDEFGQRFFTRSAVSWLGLERLLGTKPPPPIATPPHNTPAVALFLKSLR